jgi:hypothetical protein
MRCVGPVATTGERRDAEGELQDRGHLEYLGVDGKMTLKYIFK